MILLKAYRRWKSSSPSAALIRPRPARFLGVLVGMCAAVVASGGSSPVHADTLPGVPAGAMAWSGLATASSAAAPSTAAAPVQQPIYNCAATMVTRQVISHIQVTAYAQCDMNIDVFSFAWTWTDATTGQVIYTDSGSSDNTTFLSTTEAPYVGTAGNRNITLCFTSYVAGYVMSGNRCSTLFNQ
jgi:hypothetical protein